MTAPGVPSHYPCLDAYRGIGMLMVLAAHASFATGYADSTLGPYLSRFELAVPMFFVLSGFLLYRPYALAALTDRDPLATRRFLRRRALRIFPGYWVALVGVVVLFGTRGLDAWGWLSNLFLFQQVGVDEPFRITQAWSIGVELTFYLLLPVYAGVVGRRVRRAAVERRAPLLLGALAGVYAVGWAFRLAVVTTAPDAGSIEGVEGGLPWQVQSLAWLPMYLDFFAIGMALSVAAALVASGRRAPAWLESLARHPAACWTAAFGIFVLVAQMDPPDTPFGLNGPEYLPRQFAYGVASVVWLAPAMFGDQTAGRLRGVLSSSVLTYLGAVSLSFYLWHLDLITQAQRWTVDGYDDLEGLAVFAGDFWVVAGLATAATLAISAVTHRLVELPFVRLKDRPLRGFAQALRGERP